MSNIKVELGYAREDRQWLLELEAPAGSTIHQVINLSGILRQCPELMIDNMDVGVFSKQKLLSDVVREGDRIEIYRPLIIDPKEARRVRAKNKIAKKT